MADTHEAVELAGKQPKWRLSLEPDAARLEPLEAGASIEVPRAERAARIDVMNGFLTRRLLIVLLAKGKKLFRLDPAGFAAYEAWAGPPTMQDLRKSLKRRFGWSITLGALLIFLALPIPGSERGIPDVPLNAVSMAMGIGLIAAGILSRFLPSRYFLVADSLWVAIACLTTVENLIRSFSPFGALILLLQVNYILMSLKEFRRFGMMREEIAPDAT